MFACIRYVETSSTYVLKAASPLIWQANLIVVLSCLVFCQKCKKATLTEYANALVHCLTCFIDTKHINMQTKWRYNSISHWVCTCKFDSLLLHLPVLLYCFSIAELCQLEYIFMSMFMTNAWGMNFRLLFGKVGFAKLGGMLTLASGWLPYCINLWAISCLQFW